MTVSPLRSRRRGGTLVRARQNVETLEHQTQANVLLAFKLSMVSGNGVNSVPRPSYRTYRKMADAGVQYEPQDVEFNGNRDTELESSFTNQTVAEINTSGNISELDQPSYNNTNYEHRPLSLQSSSSSSSSSNEERGEKKRTLNPSEQMDVDAICVQQSAVELTSPAGKNIELTEPEKIDIPEKEESSCGLDCLYFTMQCCECTIL
ncbi:uncharacterized protein LOC128996732 isoform X2 [Macrosteles quadrilineatus]|uniref:uncharacterized protein LOC128996732 isoform X2 n=1 Tax=Macrosteles quadrilineatus TaxID=74068 RepID=UPI0023E11C3F|nr:uncharacterized protein LOC128996732 isoform X2 [Macrosteles quadrilineatus]